MKNSRIRLQIVGTLVALICAATLFAFRPMPGGDYFEIQVNNKTLIQHYVHVDKQIKSLDLTSYKGEVLNVYYSECGKVGTKRTLSVRAGDKVLKSWNFEDVAADTKRPPMPCNVNDILSVTKNNSGKLSLVYASREHSSGEILATLNTNEAKASLK